METTLKLEILPKVLKDIETLNTSREYNKYMNDFNADLFSKACDELKHKSMQLKHLTSILYEIQSLEEIDNDVLVPLIMTIIENWLNRHKLDKIIANKKAIIKKQEDNSHAAWECSEWNDEFEKDWDEDLVIHC